MPLPAGWGYDPQHGFSVPGLGPQPKGGILGPTGWYVPGHQTDPGSIFVRGGIGRTGWYVPVSINPRIDHPVAPGQPRGPIPPQPNDPIAPITPDPAVPNPAAPGTGTGNDPLSTLAAAYMASIGGGGAAAATPQAPIIIPPSDSSGGSGVMWAVVGVLLGVVGLYLGYRWTHRKKGKAA